MSRSKFEEIEYKFLEVDPQEIDAKLLALGATKQPRRLFRRYVMDFPDKRLAAKNGWLRVRDEGDRITIAYKERQGVQVGQPDQGMREVEFTTDNFDNAVELLKTITLNPKFYEENYRTAYQLDGVEIVVDEWPLIPPYVEIEGDSLEAVEVMSQRLGFDVANKLVCSTMQVYERYGIDENSYSYLTFEKQQKK